MVTTNDDCNLLSDVIVIITITNSKAIADGPVGQVLAAPLFFKMKMKLHFTETK